MKSTPAVRILTTCEEAVVRRATADFHPSALVDLISPESIRNLEPAAGLVVSTTDEARTARASGFDGAIAILAAPRNEDEQRAFRDQGSWFVVPARGAEGLVAVFRDAIEIESDGTVAAPTADIARARRLIAAGELVVRLRHAINNPLAALMAEVQLLQLEAPNAETRASATRMLDLVRRLSELTRSLESVRDR